MDELLNIIFSTWQILGEMSVYLLFGFLIAGILHVIIPQAFIERHLSGKGILKSVKAALIGVPMPLCSCGVIPVTASLKRHGAGKGATISFLASTPQTGIDCILITYGLLGWLFAVTRIITAFATGIICGTATELIDNQDDGKIEVSENPESPSKNKFFEIFQYGFINLPKDIGKSLILGLIIAGLITTLVPKDLFTTYLNDPFLSMVVMMLIGLPLYVCSTGSVPIAAAFLQMGVNPGAVLVFLITGPATNAATVTIISKILNKKSAVIYLLTIAVCAFVAGAILNLFANQEILYSTPMHHKMLPLWLKHTGAIVLLCVLFGSYIAGKKEKHSCCESEKVENSTDSEHETLELTVSGMHCSHCVNTIERSLKELGNITSANANLSEGKVIVKGTDLNKDNISKIINELGYNVKEK